MKIYQINGETGESFEREATKDEIDELNATRKNYLDFVQNEINLAENKEIKLKSVADKLRALGLDEDEVSALLG